VLFLFVARYRASDLSLLMDTGGGGHVSGSGASGSHSSGLSPNVASMTVMPPLNPLTGFGFGGAPAAHGGPVYPAQPLATTGCSPLYLPPPAGVVGPMPYPAAVSSPPHSLVAAHCGSPYPPALQSPGGHASGLYATGSSAAVVVANGSASKLLVGRHMCAICEDAASGKHYGVYRWLTATSHMRLLVSPLTRWRRVFIVKSRLVYQYPLSACAGLYLFLFIFIYFCFFFAPRVLHSRGL